MNGLLARWPDVEGDGFEVGYRSLGFFVVGGCDLVEGCPKFVGIVCNRWTLSDLFVLC